MSKEKTHTSILCRPCTFIVMVSNTPEWSGHKMGLVITPRYHRWRPDSCLKIDQVTTVVFTLAPKKRAWWSIMFSIHQTFPIQTRRRTFTWITFKHLPFNKTMALHYTTSIIVHMLKFSITGDDLASVIHLVRNLAHCHWAVNDHMVQQASFHSLTLLSSVE